MGLGENYSHHVSFRKISIWVQGGGPNVSEAIHGQASSYKGIVRKFGTPQSAWMRHPIEVKELQGPQRSLRLYRGEQILIVFFAVLSDARPREYSNVSRRPRPGPAASPICRRVKSCSESSPAAWPRPLLPYCCAQCQPRQFLCHRAPYSRRCQALSTLQPTKLPRRVP